MGKPSSSINNMMRRFLIAVAFVLAFASGQGINPNSIPGSTKDQWCESQISACPLLCLQMPGASETPKSNNCDSKSLAYSCICSNGQSPNASQYSQTMPYFICTQQNNNCVDSCNGDHSCQSQCRTKHPCGAQNPQRVNITTRVSTTATKTSPPTDVVYTGFGASATGDSKKGSSSVTVAIDIGRVYGLFIVMGGVLAGFAVLL